MLSFLKKTRDFFVIPSILAFPKKPRGLLEKLVTFPLRNRLQPYARNPRSGRFGPGRDGTSAFAVSIN
jgi:hypothetical protein